MAEKTTTAEYDETATCWHLMVTTRKGHVSMLQNLDAPTARQAFQRLMPDTRPVEYINVPESGSCCYSAGSRTYGPHDDWIDKVNILGPEGVKLDPWRGVKPKIVDLSPYREIEDQERAWRKKESDALASMASADDVVAAWFTRCVAEYEGASTEACELFDGAGGSTLKRWANRHAPDGINVTQKDMEKWLDRRGIKSRNAMFAKRYDGIRHVIFGDVRTGSYGT